MALLAFLAFFQSGNPEHPGNPEVHFYCPFESLCPTGPPQIEIKLIALTVLEIAFLHISGNPEKSGNPEIF